MKAPPNRRRVTFAYMGAFWSMPIDRFLALQAIIEDGQGFDLADLGARRIKRRPPILDWQRIT